MKKIFKGILIVAGSCILIAAGVLGFFTIREYRPDPVEIIDPAGGSQELDTGHSFTVLSFNTGYGGLSAQEDFFMDGGTKVHPESEELVRENLEGIAGILKEAQADVYFLQEVDLDSKRSFGINEADFYQEQLGLSGMFAYNYKCVFVPFPLPPIGKVESGLLTMTDLKVTDASRIALPVPFSWPVRTCNLKRCMLETRIPVGTGKDQRELVLINFHLEAYDDGEGKAAQTQMLTEKLEMEYAKGNYVIAGGDFNQTFSNIDKYPIRTKEYWTPGALDEADLPEHFSFANDDTYPTCRLLNEPYSPETSQVYVIDGYIVSDNLKVLSCSVIDQEFRYTDHQPVKLMVELQENPGKKP